MDIQIVLFIVGCALTLVGVIYAAVQYEIRKLRKQGHTHANRLIALSLALALVCQKLGIPFKGWKEDE